MLEGALALGRCGAGSGGQGGGPGSTQLLMFRQEEPKVISTDVKCHSDGER